MAASGSRPIRAFMLVLVLMLLGGLAWGAGWAAHSLLDLSTAELPKATAEPASLPMATSSPATPPLTATSFPATPLTMAPPTIPPLSASGTPRSTSTPVPTLASTPTKAWTWETVRQRDTLYRICRRHCQGKWRSSAVPPDLEEYAREVAELNGLIWLRPNGPRLYVGQELRMLPCP